MIAEFPCVWAYVTICTGKPWSLNTESAALPNYTIYVFRKIMGFRGLFETFLITRHFPESTIPLLRKDEAITRFFPVYYAS
jgi:hypothetical protein